MLIICFYGMLLSQAVIAQTGNTKATPLSLDACSLNLNKQVVFNDEFSPYKIGSREERKWKTHKTFSIINISAGSLFLGAGIFLVADKDSESMDRQLGKIAIIGGALATSGGIILLKISSKKLKSLKEKEEISIEASPTAVSMKISF